MSKNNLHAFPFSSIFSADAIGYSFSPALTLYSHVGKILYTYHDHHVFYAFEKLSMIVENRKLTVLRNVSNEMNLNLHKVQKLQK